MSVTIGTSLQSLGTGADLPAEGVAIRGSHWRTLASNIHYVRSRLPPILSHCREETVTSATYVTLIEWEGRLSANSSETVQLEVFGVQVDVRLTVTDGVDTTNGVVSIGGTEGSASLGTALTAAPLSGGAGDLLTFTVEVKTSSSPGTLRGLRVYEVTHTAATIT